MSSSQKYINCQILTEQINTDVVFLVHMTLYEEVNLQGKSILLTVFIKESLIKLMLNS